MTVWLMFNRKAWVAIWWEFHFKGLLWEWGKTKVKTDAAKIIMTNQPIEKIIDRLVDNQNNHSLQP